MNNLKDIKESLIVTDKAKTTLFNILEDLERIPTIKVRELKKINTAIIVIDMINGFAKEGALYSERIEKTIPYIANRACRVSVQIQLCPRFCG